MKNILILSFFLTLFYWNTNAQKLHLETHLFPSLAYQNTFETGYNGTAFAIEYQKTLTSDWDLLTGLEYSFVGWGNQGLVELGLSRNLMKKEKLSLNAELTLLNGLAWFRPKSLYVWGGMVGVTLAWNVRKRSSLTLGTGIRYTQCPAYKDYSRIYSYLDIPIHIGWQIDLEKDE